MDGLHGSGLAVRLGGGRDHDVRNGCAACERVVERLQARVALGREPRERDVGAERDDAHGAAAGRRDRQLLPLHDVEAIGFAVLRGP